MYDIIGDIHGCYEELLQLIDELGYKENKQLYYHPEGRILIFLGDLTDRGPHSIPVVQFVTRHVHEGLALYVPGNHCEKLYRLFIGRNVQIVHGLETTVEELRKLPSEEKGKVKQDFIHLVEQAPPYLILDDGRLIVSHAGLRQDYIGRYDKKVRVFCLYGDVTGDRDEQGFPVRRDWAREYHGDSWIVYGHTPVKQPRFIHHTVNIDTGCVFGGHLTALRYPEMIMRMVPSTQDFLADRFRFDYP